MKLFWNKFVASSNFSLYKSSSKQENMVQAKEDNS